MAVIPLALKKEEIWKLAKDQVPSVRAKSKNQDNRTVRNECVELQSAITPGQTIVFYLGDKVAGSGIIAREII